MRTKILGKIPSLNLYNDTVSLGNTNFKVREHCRYELHLVEVETVSEYNVLLKSRVAGRFFLSDRFFTTMEDASSFYPETFGWEAVKLVPETKRERT